MDVPTDGNWIPWIITIGVSVIVTLATSLVGLARMIKEMYQKTIEDLTARVVKLDADYKLVIAENASLKAENASLRARLEVNEKRIEF